MSFPRKFLLALLCWLLAAPAAAMRVELSLGALKHPAFAADGVRVRLDLLKAGTAEIVVDSLAVGDENWRGLRLICEGFAYDGRSLDCPRGQLYREDARGHEPPPLPFALAWRDDGLLEFALSDIDALALSPLVKRLRGWNPRGRIDLSLRADARDARLRLAVRDLSFANRVGDVAASGMHFTLHADARREVDAWRWEAALDWPAGDLRFVHWRGRGGMNLRGNGRLTDAVLEIDQARLAADGVGALNASLRWDRARGEATEWGLVSERIDLAGALDAWLQPWLDSLGFPAWRARGEVLFAAEWRAGALRRFYAGLENAELADPTGYLALSGLEARVPWEADAATEAEIRVAAGRIGELPLGAFAVPLRLAGASARIEHLVAPMLDGRFEVEKLVLEKAAGDWRAEFSGGIDGVSMPRIASLFRLPRMEGVLNARIPRIAFEDKILRLDGAIGVELFDGGMIVHQLRVLDPFSAERHLLFDVTAMRLDLGMLTRTFAFGSIEGRFDIHLRELEMAGWRPLRFDARIESSAGDYPRILSLGALKDIAELGEPEEGKALRRIPARSIGGFGYERIGLGCTLADGVCALFGIPGRDEPHRVQIMTGSGFPSIDIYGYNRRIDWEALVARFRELLAGRPGVVIE